MISLIIIEDNDETKSELEHFFSNQSDIRLLGYAENKKSGAQIVKKFQPQVVVLDVDLSSLSSIRCIKLLKLNSPKSQIIIYSQSERENTIVDVINLGVVAYILKSGDLEELKQAVLEVANGGSAISPRVARTIINHMLSLKNDKSSLEIKERFKITDREEQVLKLLTKGYKYKQIAAELFISEKTLKSHIYRIYEKLEVENRTEAINLYFGSKA